MKHYPSIKIISASLLIFGLASSSLVLADDPPKTPEDLAREAAIADFAKKQEAMNWPEKFDRIGKEMGVPGDLLAGVAFAETRWEHLTWPEGETVSPENGMPRPYGVMSLWDNDYFGHSLVDAAKLIGKTPDDLKKDPELNIRGAAALLKQLYGENAKPEGTTADDIESWRNAVVKYSGIPEKDLSNRHGLDVYDFMNQGYDQYGMHWKAHPVNMAPMRAEVKKIVDEERKKKIAAMTPEELAGLDESERPKAATNGQTQATSDPGKTAKANKANKANKAEKTTAKPAGEIAAVVPPVEESDWKMWAILGAGVFALGLSYVLLRKKSPSPKN